MMRFCCSIAKPAQSTRAPLLVQGLMSIRAALQRCWVSHTNIWHHLWEQWLQAQHLHRAAHRIDLGAENPCVYLYSNVLFGGSRSSAIEEAGRPALYHWATEYMWQKFTIGTMPFACCILIFISLWWVCIPGAQQRSVAVQHEAEGRPRQKHPAPISKETCVVYINKILYTPSTQQRAVAVQQEAEGRLRR